MTMPETRRAGGRARRAIRIGLTGPIGCGKSTVARWLGEHPGVVVIDADEVARDVREEPDVRQRIAERFGTTDPASLASVVFGIEAEMRALEAIVHPAVRPRIMARLAEADAAGATAVVIEAIKLVEGGLADACDEVWLVTCDPDVQRARLLERGTLPADADQRIAAQGNIATTIAAIATRVIEASGGRPETRRLAEDGLAAAIAGGSESRQTPDQPIR